MLASPERQTPVLSGAIGTTPPTTDQSLLDTTPSTWDLEALFTNEAQWRIDLETLRKDAQHLGHYQHLDLSNAESLYHCLETYQRLHERVGRLETYAMLRAAENTLDQRAQMMQDESATLRSEVETIASFIGPAIIDRGWPVLAEMLRVYPPLQRYRFYLENVERARPHTLSSEVEAALAVMSPQTSTPYDVYRAITERDLYFRPFESAGQELTVHHGNAEAHLESSDPAVRRLAYNSYTDGYLAAKHSLAATLIGQIKSSLAEARARNFSSSFERLLFEQHISQQVYDSAVGTCLTHQHVFQRYFELRAKYFGVASLGEHDIFAPFSPTRSAIPYRKGIELITSSLAPLGSRYQEILKRGLLQDGWADVEPREHKDSSQFSAGSYGTKPYLMISYNGSFIDVSTLAHEAGHSVHTQLTSESQPSCYFDYVMIVGETASNLNQVLLREQTFDDAERESCLTALDDAFCYMHRYLFLMPILSFVERKAHDEYAAGRSVSLDNFCEWTRDAFVSGYGSAVTCDEERVGIKWAQFSHLYEPGYAFQYIVGISAALVLGKRLRAGEPGLQERYEEFLRAGASMPPADIFKIVGIDIESPELYRAAFDEVEQYNQILEKITQSLSS